MKCFYKIFVQGSTDLILLDFYAKNLPHRQAADIERCRQIADKIIKL